MAQTYRFKPTVCVCASGVVLTHSMVRDIAAAICPKDVKDCRGNAVIGLDFHLRTRLKRHSEIIRFKDDDSTEKLLFSLAYFPGLRGEPVKQLQWDQEAIEEWWKQYGSCESTRNVQTRSIRYPSFVSRAFLRLS